jgi:RHS repeat-associated protein
MIAYYTQPEGTEPSIYSHYSYDSSGHRIKKLVRKQGGQHVESSVYIDNLFEYHELIKPQSKVTENNTIHILDNRGAVAIVRIGDASPGDGAPEQNIKYYLGDHLGSTNIVIDIDGNLINREEYTPYGETSFGSFARKRYRFTGKERDEESSLYYYGARYYVPWLTRWNNSDPAKEGANTYVFVNNNPVRLIDTGGLQASGRMKPQIQVNRSAGINAGQDLGKLAESKRNVVVGEEVTSRSGLGGSRHDVLIEKPGITGSLRSLESKLIDFSKKTYRLASGELKTGALESRLRRDFSQHMKHLEVLKDAVQNISRTSRSGEQIPLNEIGIYQVKNATSQELKFFKKSISKFVESLEGTKPGIGAIMHDLKGTALGLAPGILLSGWDAIATRNIERAEEITLRRIPPSQADISLVESQCWKYEGIKNNTPQWSSDSPFYSYSRIRNVILGLGRLLIPPPLEDVQRAREIYVNNLTQKVY